MHVAGEAKRGNGNLCPEAAARQRDPCPVTRESGGLRIQQFAVRSGDLNGEVCGVGGKLVNDTGSGAAGNIPAAAGEGGSAKCHHREKSSTNPGVSRKSQQTPLCHVRPPCLTACGYCTSGRCSGATFVAYGPKSGYGSTGPQV